MVSFLANLDRNAEFGVEYLIYSNLQSCTRPSREWNLCEYGGRTRNWWNQSHESSRCDQKAKGFHRQRPQFCANFSKTAIVLRPLQRFYLVRRLKRILFLLYAWMNFILNTTTSLRNGCVTWAHIHVQFRGFLGKQGFQCQGNLWVRNSYVFHILCLSLTFDSHMGMLGCL